MYVLYSILDIHAQLCTKVCYKKWNLNSVILKVPALLDVYDK